MTVTQKVVTVANDDATINAEIATQNTDGFVVFSLTVSDTNVILLLQKVNNDTA